jgi:hypothetical protein
MHATTTPARRAATTAPLLLLSIIAAAALVGVASGHAVMVEPKSRAWIDYLENYNYNPHAVSAGGVTKTSDGGKLQWPKRRANGICGDAYDENKWDKPGKLTATYTAGSTIGVDVLLAQNHLGRITVRVCPIDATSEDKCTNLER